MVKTKAQHKTDFADNAVKAITPSHARDLIDTTLGGGVQLMITGTPTIQITTGTILTLYDGSIVDTGYSASQGGGTITIPTGGDGIYLIGFSCTILPLTNEVSLKACVFKSGAVIGYLQTGVTVARTSVAATPPAALCGVNMSLHGLAALVANDVLDIRLNAVPSTVQDYAIAQAQFFAQRVA